MKQEDSSVNNFDYTITYIKMCEPAYNFVQEVIKIYSHLATQKTAFSSISSLLAQPIAKAPPDPPSPITMDMIGTFRPNIVFKLWAMASP